MEGRRALLDIIAWNTVGYRTSGRYRLSLLLRTESVSPILFLFSAGRFLTSFGILQRYLFR